MSDASSLRNLLRRTDATAPAIQQAAGAMMKHYDRSPGVAVVEWRNALHQARPDQHLPLLYVANETLQNSKRNRGNKFLEAFSPVLGQSLSFICQNNPNMVEKVRRTVKIWGERHVFSIRYVNELLKGLDAYRNSTAAAPRPPVTSGPVPAPEGGGSFSPLTAPEVEAPSPVKAPAPAPTSKAPAAIDIDKELALDDGLPGPGDNDSDSYDDDGIGDDASEDGDLFGDSGDRLLNIDVDLDKAAKAATTDAQKGRGTSNRKRRRGSNASAGGATPSKSRRRQTILSTNSLMELWNQVSSLQQRHDNSQALLSGVTPEYLEESSVTDQMDTLVGDALLDDYKRVLMYEKRVVDQRRELHNIAQKRRALELDAVRYLPWLEAALKQDQDDIDFCDKVQAQIKTFSRVHSLAKAARDERLAKEAQHQRELEEQQKKKEEEEDRKKFMESAMSRVTEAQPGMVWNRAAGEYQYPNTEESWRD